MLSTARRLVQDEHYARGGSNTGTFVHGLIQRAQPSKVWGVAWWIPPTRTAAESNWTGDWRRVLALHRLVCIPEAPRNAASFLIAGSIRLIEQSGDWECLLTYADTAQGHDGAIYRATNWEYCGLTDQTDMWVDTDGRQVSRKAGPTTRTASEMFDLGYERRLSRKHRFRRVLEKPRQVVGQMTLGAE